MRADEYTIVEDVIAPGEIGSDYHLLVWQTHQFTELLWSSYLATAHGGFDYGDVQPAPRRVTTFVESECFPVRDSSAACAPSRAPGAPSRSKAPCGMPTTTT